MFGFVRLRKILRGRFRLWGVVVARPHGFQEFIKKQGFHSLYLVTTDTNSPVKVGIAANPVHRLGDLQSANFVELHIYRYWWMPGRRITARIESAFKDHFRSRNVRGEWFDLPLPTAEAFIETSIRSLGTWGVRQYDLVEFMDHRERQKYHLPPDAPTPLRGVA
jgi:hypothetical protein